MAKKKTREPRVVHPDDIDPHHNWSRPIQAPGHTQVDFEERVNFRRLHDYRLSRVRAALAGSGLGALLCAGSIDDRHAVWWYGLIAGPHRIRPLTRSGFWTAKSRANRVEKETARM